LAQKSLQDLFYEELEDLYDAEKQIVKALPKVAGAAASDELRNALEEHLEQTKEHVNRLEQVFRTIGREAKAKKCDGMKGLLEEGEKVISEIDESPVRDAALIAAAQKVEHYEISGYGTTRTFAQLLGQDEAVELLDETLEEEKEADERLTEIAESEINIEAAEGEGEGEEAEGEEGETAGSASGRGASSGQGAQSRGRSSSSKSTASKKKTQKTRTAGHRSSGS
jgi:ferritin-like metal-binding protein YciE